MTNRKTVVLSLSGGMDSTCLLIHLLAKGYVVHPISFNYGQKHSLELQRAKANIEYLRKTLPDGDCRVAPQTIVDLSSVMGMFSSALTNPDQKVPEGHYADDNMKATVVPNRNAIFSSIVYGYALSISKELGYAEVDIALGVHSGDHAIYPDCTPEFITALQAAFKIGNYESDKVSYNTPYLNGDKTSILRDCLVNCTTMNIDFDIVLANTLTSYNPDKEGRSSGKSGSDIERIEAFINIGRKDPVEYQAPWDEVVKHAKTILHEKNSDL